MDLQWVIKKSRTIFVLRELFWYYRLKGYSPVMAELLPPPLGAEASHREGQNYNQDSGRT